MPASSRTSKRAAAFAGLALGYARAHYGRTYHVVEVTHTPRWAGDTVPTEGRVARALCGLEPGRWGRPYGADGPARNYLHQKCRGLLLEVEALKAERPD